MKLKTITIMILLSVVGLFSIPHTVLALPAIHPKASFFPKLSEDQTLQTVVAEKWLEISNKEVDTLEGLCFDRQGNLWMVGVVSGRIFKVTPEKQVIVVTTLKDKYPAGLKIHKDGRIFVAYLGDLKKTGGIVSFNPDGSDMRQIVEEGKYVCDDLFFDSKGGFYFTNFVGNVGSPIGTVEYVTPDFKTITTVVSDLETPNGIVMTPNLKNVLFVTEIGRNRIDRFSLEQDGLTIMPYMGVVIYQYQGGWPDSLETDADGNLYQAMYSQGRYIVLDSETGMPFAQILIPGRENGHFRYTTHSAIIPGTNQLILAASDLEGGQGIVLYTAQAPAKAWAGYYQFQK